MTRKNLILVIIILPLALYGMFWSYVHFGGENIKNPNPSNLIMEKPGNVQQPYIHLQGAGNFRDVGKMYIDSLRFVTEGILFRSDSPSKFTNADWIQVKKLGITLIIDLRSDREAENDPYNPANGIRYVRNPVYNNDPIRSVMNHILFHRGKLNDMMAEAYIKMVRDRAASFGESLRLIANNSVHGTLIHCTAGKDRTGLLTAMILSLLGVDEQAILYDYSLSNAGFASNYEAFLEKDAPKLEMIGVPPEELKVLFMANPGWLANALEEIEHSYGNMENYLINAGGVDRKTIDRLKAHMISSIQHH